jgi:methyl-accepting chemotaxis protein
MNSTKQINAMVAEIQRETREAVASIENAKQEAEVSEGLSLQVESSLATIVQAVEEIKTVITQIATASEEQAATATVIAGNLDEITRNG